MVVGAKVGSGCELHRVWCHSVGSVGNQSEFIGERGGGCLRTGPILYRAGLGDRLGGAGRPFDEFPCGQGISERTSQPLLVSGIDHIERNAGCCCKRVISSLGCYATATCRGGFGPFGGQQLADMDLMAGTSITLMSSPNEVWRNSTTGSV